MKILLLITTSLILSSCADWNWRQAGQAWMRSLCEAEKNIDCIDASEDDW